MMEPALSTLGFIGDVIDTPGAMLRAVLAGRNPLPSVFDTSQRTSGRDVLEQWGVLGSNKEGLDFGDVAGFGAEILLDPTNLIGAGLAGKFARKAADGRYLSGKIGEWNRLVDAAHSTKQQFLRDAGDWRGAHHASMPRIPSQTIRIGDVDDEAVAALKQMRGATSAAADIPAEYGTVLRHGAPFEMQEMLDLLLGGGTESAKLPPASSALAEAAGMRAFSLPKHPDVRGMFTRVRPDAVMVDGTLKLPSSLGTTMHEMTHAFAHSHPESFARMAEAVGEAGASQGIKTTMPDDFVRLLHRLEMGTAQHTEEGIASLVGSAGRRGATRSNFPAIDYAVGGAEREGPVGDMAALMRQVAPDATAPADAAGRLLDFMSGKARRQTALVPVGDATTTPPWRAKSPRPRLGPSGRQNIRNTLSLDYMEPPFQHYQDEARFRAMLAALLGHNAGISFKGLNDQ